MIFNAGGTLADDTDVTAVNLYRDVDEDGTVTAADVHLGGPATFDANDGNVTLDLTGAIVNTEPEKWLLTYKLSPVTPPAVSFIAKLVDAAVVSAKAFFGAQAVAVGPFPAVSDEFTTSIPNNLPLNVSKEGAGTGTVTSVTPGIDCGKECSGSYPLHTQVTLTAASGAFSTFTGWSGEGCAGTGDCVVTMDGEKAVTATFDLIQQTLTVTKNGAGTGTVTSAPGNLDCGASCTADFGHGTFVALSAAPASGSGFTGWSGDDDCTDGSVTMLSATACTASFRINAPPITAPGGPYHVNEGSSVSLDGSGSSDTDGAITAYAWDLENDNTFETAGNPINDDATAKDGPAGPFTIRLRVTDNDGTTATATTTVRIDNVAPTADVGGPYTGTPGIPVDLSGSAVDPGSADTHTYAWDLDNNGSYETAGQDVQVTFSAVGAFTVGLQVTDDNGGVGTDSTDIVISVVRGDISGDQAVGLEDAILVMQVMSEMNPAGVRPGYASSGVDVNGNGKIGLEEAIYILQKVSGLR